jgi:hypothetical protein
MNQEMRSSLRKQQMITDSSDLKLKESWRQLNKNNMIDLTQVKNLSNMSIASVFMRCVSLQYHMCKVNIYRKSWTSVNFYYILFVIVSRN